jgi:phage terminase small subunit
MRRRRMSAGYRARGHSAEVNASRLCKRPDVADAIGVVLARRHAAAIPPGSKFIRIGRRGVFNLETGHFDR